MSIELARPEIVGSFGSVASTHWLASQCGMSVLERGGNAFDAAVAAGLVLQVVEPHLNGLGGEVPILGWLASDEDPFVLCGQGPAPADASIAAFAELGLEHVPGTGLLAACVPGAWGAWMTLLRDHGTWRLADVLAYPLAYAEGGFPVLPGIVTALAGCEEHFARHWPSSFAQWLPDGSLPRAGATMRNPALAATYRLLLAGSGPRGRGREGEIDAAIRAFYQGPVAEAIHDFCAHEEVLDSSGRRHRGLLAADDLAGWTARYESPVSTGYRGRQVFKPGAWTQGPVMLQQLAILEGFELDECDPAGARFVHLVAEAAKLAFADREFYYGDPDLVDVPLAALLAPEYADRRRAQIDPDLAYRGPLRPGVVPSGLRPASLPGAATVGVGVGLAPGVGEPTHQRPDGSRGDTCHLDVCDRWGNLVSATPSGGWFQSSPTLPGWGFALGTRAQMFWLDPEHPNALASSKRPRTTLTATMVRDDGRRLAFGTPGGDTQDQCSVQFLLRHLHGGLGMQQAIESPAFFSEDFPSSFFPRERHEGRLVLEGRFSPDTVDELRGAGHDVLTVDGWAIGRLSAVSRTEDGAIRAAANPRGAQGYAVGR
ncbi:gamma-glutamyltransferase family protein [Nocardioides sp. L-11A]|uniref:gamma-glutamyltransferase family protein n=1 Tax=Nocardioides sp. L-11A TaxID=3043848 RepID=UPI00249B61DD|nr:gamma-glutamyltransferase family protein [Nocardioides sp. L-11A]